MSDNEMYGFFSNMAVTAGHATSFYLNPDGAEVEVTCVARDPNDTFYAWPDKVLVGRVVRWSRVGRSDTSGLSQKMR